MFTFACVVCLMALCLRNKLRHCWLLCGWIYWKLLLMLQHHSIKTAVSGTGGQFQLSRATKHLLGCVGTQWELAYRPTNQPTDITRVYNLLVLNSSRQTGPESGVRGPRRLIHNEPVVLVSHVCLFKTKRKVFRIVHSSSSSSSQNRNNLRSNHVCTYASSPAPYHHGVLIYGLELICLATGFSGKLSESVSSSFGSGGGGNE